MLKERTAIKIELEDIFFQALLSVNIIYTAVS